MTEISDPNLHLHRARHRALLVALAFGIITWGCLNESARHWLSPHSWRETQPVQFQADLNQATLPELQLLPGIGPKTANEIEARRKTLGSWSDPKELDTVHGIGKGKMDKLREHISVETKQ